MVKGVIFDLGGVLMHLGCRWREVDQIATTALIEFLQANGIRIDGDFRASFPSAREQSWRLAEQTELEPGMQVALESALGSQVDDRVRGLMPQAVDTYFHVREQYWVSNPSGLDVLEQLSGRGLRLGAISNAEHDGLMQRPVARLGFSRYLNPVVTSARVKWRKPNPRIFQSVTDEWGIDPAEIVMVGNARWDDIEGAHRAGMRAILIEQSKRSLSQENKHVTADPASSPDATVESLTEIAAVIAQM